MIIVRSEPKVRVEDPSTLGRRKKRKAFFKKKKKKLRKKNPQASQCAKCPPSCKCLRLTLLGSPNPMKVIREWASYSVRPGTHFYR